jgi:UDP-N-acetylmuramyl pentapeptide phosphotransferase/UDP-N-acetylglucosamine-1-phosphate transferase
MMLEILMALVGAFLLTFLAVPVVIEIAARNRLFDLPSARKIHKRRISYLGGAAIFAGFLISTMLFVPEETRPEFRFYTSAVVIVFLLGLKDDLSDLSAMNKLIGQLIVASILIFAGGLRLEGMYGLFGLREVPELFSYALTYATIIVVMNTFNLIDGVDGLATSMGIVSVCVFGVYFAASEQLVFAMMAFSLGGSLIAFLIFNHQPARIFMGDSGSLLIGTVNSILVIRFIHTASDPAAVLPMNASVAVGFAVLFVPLLDTLRMFTVRLLKGHSPFRPDRNHLHHLLLDRGLTHFQITLTCVLSNLLFLGAAWYFSLFGSTAVLLTEVAIGFMLIGVLYFTRPVAVTAESEVDTPVIDINSDVNAKAE